jgi:hypothetical protein
MPSSIHQWLLLWLVRKMTADGFVVTACDGLLPQGGLWNCLPGSIGACGVRPDAWAVAPTGNAIALAEAKTHGDIVNAHTRTQLRTVGRFVLSSGSGSRLYVAVPRSAALLLDRVIHEAGLDGTRQLVRIHVPDCLLEDDRYECAQAGE